MLWVAPGKEQQFLAPLPIKRIPGIGPKGSARLNRMGVQIGCRSFPRLSLELLKRIMGNGVHHFIAKRGDQQQSGQYRNRRPPLDQSGNDFCYRFHRSTLFLESTLSYLTEKTAAQLRSNGLFARTVKLKLRCPNFKTVTRSSNSMGWPTQRRIIHF